MADAPLKERLHTDLTAAMKARDTVRLATIRMVLTAVHADEVAGTTARELSDDEVLVVVGREAKKRKEAAGAYDDAGRPELAERERAELVVLEGYLPQQLSDDEIAEVVGEALTAGGFSSKAQMGPAMKAAQAAVAGRAEGGRVAAEVRRRLN